MPKTNNVPSFSEEQIRMNAEDLHDTKGNPQQWNDTSGKLFWPAPGVWPACPTCGADGCKMVNTIQDMSIRPQPMYKNFDGVDVVQGEGQHLEEMTTPSFAPLPQNGELCRVALKDFSGDILKTCAALQSQGNLSGPEGSMAAQVVVVFHDVAAKFGKIGREDYLRKVRHAVKDSIIQTVGPPLQEHENHFFKFQLPENRVQNSKERYQAFYEHCALGNDFKLLPSFETGDSWEMFNGVYMKLLKKHFDDSFNQKVCHEERKHASVTWQAACKCLLEKVISVAMAERQDRKVRGLLEDALQSVLFDMVFPYNCISRLVKSKQQLLRIVNIFLTNGERNSTAHHHLGVRETIEAIAGQAANKVVASLRNGRDIQASLNEHVLQTNSPPSAILSRQCNLGFKGLFDVHMEVLEKEAFQLRNDVVWLKKIMLKAIKPVSAGHGMRGWKGFEEAWYSSKKKSLLYLCSSSTYYYLSRGEERSNAFFMKRPPHYHITTNLTVILPFVILYELIHMLLQHRQPPTARCSTTVYPYLPNPLPPTHLCYLDRPRTRNLLGNQGCNIQGFRGKQIRFSSVPQRSPLPYSEEARQRLPVSRR
jgi:hypothetical protein